MLMLHVRTGGVPGGSASGAAAASSGSAIPPQTLTTAQLPAATPSAIQPALPNAGTARGYGMNMSSLGSPRADAASLAFGLSTPGHLQRYLQ